MPETRKKLADKRNAAECYKTAINLKKAKSKKALNAARKTKVSYF